MTQTKEIDISEYCEGENPKVVIKRLSFGAQNDILDAIANVNIKGKSVEASPKYGLLRTLVLLKCIVSAPFPTTMEYFQNELPSILGDFLFIQIDEYNNLKNDKKKI
jgi:hypothetical protein